jgi:hypothetical protein
MLGEVGADDTTAPIGMHVECFAEMSKPSAIGGAPHELNVGMAVEERPGLFADLGVSDLEPLEEVCNIFFGTPTCVCLGF